MEPSTELKVGSNICVVTGYNYCCREHGEFTTRINLNYCLKQRYNFRAYTRGFDESRFPSWSKLLFIKDALQHYEWVFWIDADAVFTNHKLRIERIIQAGGDIFICRETPDMIFSCGVFMIHQCEWSFWLIDEMWNTTGWDWLGSWEQSAFNKLWIEGKVGNRMVYYQMRDFNSVPAPAPHPEMEWQVGDYVAHRMGDYPSKPRIEMLTECLKKNEVQGV